MKQKYGENTKLCSIIIYIKTKDIYSDIAKDVDQLEKDKLNVDHIQ